jgi:uncharacterized membrane protein
MKVSVDYTHAHEAILKLSNGEDLKKHDRDILLRILEAAKGDLIPTIDELEQQRRNVEALNRIEDPDSPQFKRVIAWCTEFENKYC